MHNSSAPVTETYEVTPIYWNEIIWMSISADFYMQLCRTRTCDGAVEKEETIRPHLPRSRDGVLASSGARDCKVPEKLLLHVPIFGAWESRHTLALHEFKWNRNRREKIKADLPRLLCTEEYVKSTHLPEIIRENVKISRPLRAYVSRPSL